MITSDAGRKTSGLDIGVMEGEKTMQHGMWQQIVAFCHAIGTVLHDIAAIARWVTTVSEAFLFALAAIAATCHVLHHLGYPVPDLLPFIQVP